MLSAIDTRRCCAPSCRSRSSRRRSSSPIRSMRSRERRSSSIFARSSASSRSLSSASAAAAPTASDVPAHLRERRVVHDRRHALALSLDLGDRARGVAGRQLVVAPASVDVAPPLREPEDELQRRVLERLGERVAHLAGARRRAQPRHQLAHRAALRHPGAHERARNRYGTSASGMTEMMNRTSTAAPSEPAVCTASWPITADHQRDARGVHRRVEPALGTRGPAPAPDQADRHRHEHADPDQVHERAPDAHDGLVVLDQDRVAGTAVAAVARRIEEQVHRNEPDCHEQVADRHDAAVPA